MHNCKSCGAPLNQHPKCTFCGVLNAIDLFGITKNHQILPSEESARQCPNCKVALKTLNVGTGDNAFYIENCSTCMGLFFDEGELPQILSEKTEQVHIDHKLLAMLIENNPTRTEKIVYRPCPICQKMMNRENFGARSGVIVDHCKGHGIWLEAGELNQLLQWSAAGGQILNRQTQAEKIVEAQKQEALKKAKAAEEWEKLRSQEKSVFSSSQPKSIFSEMDLGEELLKNLFRLFK